MTDVEPSLTNMRGGRHTWLSCVGLLLTLVVSVAYLLIGVLHVRPLASNYALTVELGQSGGLLPNQDVALHGVQIGKVESLEISRPVSRPYCESMPACAFRSPVRSGYRRCHRRANNTLTSTPPLVRAPSSRTATRSHKIAPPHR